MPEFTFTLGSKHPHTTASITIEYPIDSPPLDLIDSLTSMGWKMGANLPSVNGMVTRYYHKAGSGLFGGWTEEEKSDNVRDLKRVLRKFHIPYKWIKCSYRELV